MNKINFQNGKEPAINDANLNQMQDNMEEVGVVVSSTEPTTNEKVWIQKGKNLFDKDNAPILNMYVKTSDNTFEDKYFATNSTYIQIQPNTTYTISKIAGKTFRIATSNAKPINGGSVITTIADHTSSTITITTDSNAKYLFVNYYNTDNGDTVGESVIRNSIQIEQGSTATEYEAYVEKAIHTKNENGVYEEFYNESKMNKTHYSTAEQVIGTWIDRKPLYRKTIKISTAANTNVDYSLSDLGIYNVDTVIVNVGKSTSHYIKNVVGGGYSPISYYISDTDRAHVFLNAQQKFIIQNQNNAERDYFITLEYTKTTD